MSMVFSFVCPDTSPEASPEALWVLQLKLDECAQKLFGPRNPSKKLYQPTFEVDGPNVRNTKNQDGGFAELSLAAAKSWPAAIHELAHETIHLLDPRPGYPIGDGASWLEEGIAVNFSLAISSAVGNKGKVSIKKYSLANGLVNRLGGDLFRKVSDIRKRCGHFSDATVLDVLEFAPNLPRHVAEKLCMSFYK
ncbi:hypothetical protein [Pseudomonas syringae]|uniref:hypothetical protein n=1 Tax=Pseudomonas syringae TaxID=317 RepID=UPI003F74D2D8